MFRRATGLVAAAVAAVGGCAGSTGGDANLGPRVAALEAKAAALAGQVEGLASDLAAAKAALPRQPSASVETSCTTRVSRRAAACPQIPFPNGIRTCSVGSPT